MQTTGIGGNLRQLHASLTERGLYPYLLFACVVLAVWVPGGFNVGPYKIEDLALMRDHGPHGNLLDTMVTRLFRDLPVWLGLHLTPGSLQGWQWMLLLLAFARGALFHAILRRMLPGQELFALLGGLLALFHPADSSYFYVNSTGMQFALALSLAGALCAVDYLDSGRRSMLAGMAVFEFLAGFTYSGFLPLTAALPVGAWVLKWVRESTRPKLSYLALVSAVPVVLLGVSLAFIDQKVGRDSGVADFHLHGVLSGYALAAKRLVLGFGTLANGFEYSYLIPLAVVAIAGLWVGWRAYRAEPMPAASLRLHLVTVAGLLLLAALSYLPYSLSTVRFEDKRQLLMAGVFAYGAAVYVLLLALRPHLYRSWLRAALVAVLAAAVTLAALEKREFLLGRYRAVEAVLAAVAQAVPNPASGSFILIQMDSGQQVRKVPSLYGKQISITVALQLLYGDETLQAGLNVFGKRQVAFDTKGVLTNLVYRGPQHHKQRVYAGYDRLIVVHYPRRGPARVLGAQWLEQKAGVAKPEVPYAPGKLIHAGPGRSTACVLLEHDYRPKYCVNGGLRPHAMAVPAAATRATDSSPAARTR